MLPQLHSGESVMCFKKQVKIQRTAPGLQSCVKYLGLFVSKIIMLWHRRCFFFKKYSNEPKILTCLASVGKLLQSLRTDGRKEFSY